MKVVRLCVLGVLIAVFASCNKLQDGGWEDTEGEFLKAEISLEDCSGANGVDNAVKSAMFPSENKISSITLWIWDNSSGKLKAIETFSPAAPPSLFLRRGEYTFAATANLAIIDPTMLSTLARVQQYFNTSNKAQGKDGALPLFCQGTSTSDDEHIYFNLLFSHSWAKITLTVDDSGLNNAFKVTAVSIKSSSNSVYDKFSTKELGMDAKGNLYCPTMPSTTLETSKPYIEVTGQLSTSFTGTVTYRLRVNTTEPGHYHYTLKPTLSYLVNHDPSWEISGDYGLGDFSKCSLQVQTSQTKVNSLYKNFYPKYWTELTSSGSASIAMSLTDAAQGIVIPNKWYSIDVTSSNSTLASKTATVSNYKTVRIGDINYKFTSDKATTPLLATVTSIWQPLIEYDKDIPACPDIRYSDCHLGISQTDTDYTGEIKCGSTRYSFGAPVSSYNQSDCRFGVSSTYSNISVPGRTETPPFLLVTDDAMIIAGIQKATENKLWGSATNLRIIRQNITYTLPSNYTGIQKYVYPDMPVAVNYYIGGCRKNVTVNGMKVVSY